MSKQVINLTHLVAKKEIDLILAAYPDASSRKAFRSFDTRNHLLLYVIKRIPSSYVSIELNQQDSFCDKILQLSLIQQQHIQNLIHEGIQYLLLADNGYTSYPTHPEALNKDFSWQSV